MNVVQMTKKVRIRCGRCSTVNVSVVDGSATAQSQAQAQRREQ
jgi:hypothetical protein